MRSKIRSRDFGVLEIILSVAIIAAFSVFVLRLFVAASKDRQRMLDLDRANAAAVSLIEQFKGGSAPFSLSSSLGGAPANGRYDRTVPVESGLTARVRIQKSGSNAGGGLYAIDVSVCRADGARVLDLNGARYFSGESSSGTGG